MNFIFLSGKVDYGQKIKEKKKEKTKKRKEKKIYLWERERFCLWLVLSNQILSVKYVTHHGTGFLVVI